MDRIALKIRKWTGSLEDKKKSIRAQLGITDTDMDSAENWNLIEHALSAELMSRNARNRLRKVGREQNFGGSRNLKSTVKDYQVKKMDRG